MFYFSFEQEAFSCKLALVRSGCDSRAAQFALNLLRLDIRKKDDRRQCNVGFDAQYTGKVGQPPNSSRPQGNYPASQHPCITASQPYINNDYPILTPCQSYSIPPSQHNCTNAPPTLPTSQACPNIYIFLLLLLNNFLFCICII